MEALVAFSVACNVLQLVDTGSKILSRSIELRNSSDGLLAEHKSLRDAAVALNGLNADLETALTANSPSHPTAVEQSLIKANQTCLTVSNDFVILPDSLKLKQSSAIASFRSSIRALWNRDRIAATEKALAEARNTLNTSFLVYIHSKQAGQATEATLLSSATEMEKTLLQSVQMSASVIGDDVAALSAKVEKLSIDAHCAAGHGPTDVYSLHCSHISPFSGRLPPSLPTAISTLSELSESASGIRWWGC